MSIEKVREYFAKEGMEEFIIEFATSSADGAVSSSCRRV